MKMDKIPRIGIVEDGVHVRDYFTEIIEGAEDLKLGFVAASLEEAQELVSDPHDLVLTDLGLPDGNGMTLIPKLKAAGSRSLVITAFSDRETVVGAITNGADGYLLKDSDEAVILDGIRTTLNSGSPISPVAAVYLLEQLRAPAAQQEATQSGTVPEAEALTSRERELLSLFAKGHSYKSAARVLGISPLTVGGHVKAIYRKLDVNSRGAAVYEAMQRGELSMK